MDRYTEKELLEAKFEDAEPLLEGLIYRGQNTLLVAPEKSAKTMFSLQVALALAHGVKLLNWNVPQPVKVTYIAFEDTHEANRDMVRRLRNGMGITNLTDRFILRKAPTLHLHTPPGARALRAVLEEDRPDVLMLDPWYRLYKGSANDDGLMGEVTAVLNEEASKFKHATWIPHHEHKLRTDFGVEFETKAQRYAGVWTLGAWVTNMYGFHFSAETHNARFMPLVERFPRLKAINLVLRDEPDILLFDFSAADRVIQSLPELEGMSIGGAAKYLGMHRESMDRALHRMQKDGTVVLVKQGRETIIGVPSGHSRDN